MVPRFLRVSFLFPFPCCEQISSSTLRNGQLVFESKSAERALANYPFFPPQIDARARVSH